MTCYAPVTRCSTEGANRHTAALHIGRNRLAGMLWAWPRTNLPNANCG